MKKIGLVATGGTIACRQTADGLTPALHAQQLVEDIHIASDVEIVSRDVFAMDSSNIQPEEWSAIAHAVDETLRPAAVFFVARARVRRCIRLRFHRLRLW